MTGELLSPTAYAKRAHVDRRTVLRWCREDPLFPAVRIDPWPGVTRPRYRIAVDGIAAWAAARRQTGIDGLPAPDKEADA